MYICNWELFVVAMRNNISKLYRATLGFSATAQFPFSVAMA